MKLETIRISTGWVLLLGLLGLAACASGQPLGENLLIATATPTPANLETGDAGAALAALDGTITRIMDDYRVPGGAFAMAKGGRLIHARGYGLACTDSGKAVRPDSLFRIASVSKPVTAVAMLKLVEEGQLTLDDRAFRILDHLQPLDGQAKDPRIRDITIRHLLEHSAGWDRRRNFDPIDSHKPAEHLSEEERPAGCAAIIQYMLGRPLDFAPGTRHAYSNLGYCVLSQIIEKVTGQAYESYVRAEVLAPIGIERMRVGGSRLGERLDGEVCYYDYPGAVNKRSLFPDGPTFVPQPYGSMNLQAAASSGGWIASAVDLVRFVLAVDGRPSPPDILRPETIRIMTARSDLPDWQKSDYYYALGWEISADGTRGIWSHDGAMPGTRSLLAVTSDGYAVALVFNSDPRRGGEFMQEVVDAIRRTVDQHTEWPGHDLLPQYLAVLP
jgi:N-acyl-D-amino-acid deacylase